MKRGLSRSLTDSPLRRSGHIEGPDCTDSQADSPGCPDLQQDGGLHRGGPTTSPAWLSGSRATSSGTASRSPASRARGRWRDRLFTWLLYFRAVHTVLAFEKWSGRRDLNPRPLDPQDGGVGVFAAQHGRTGIARRSVTCGLSGRACNVWSPNGPQAARALAGLRGQRPIAWLSVIDRGIPRNDCSIGHARGTARRSPCPLCVSTRPPPGVSRSS